MAKQARVLNESEIKRLYKIASFSRNPKRNQLLVTLSYYCGLRACEIAALNIEDVLDASGNPKAQVFLRKEQTKGNEAHTVYVSSRVQREIKDFVGREYVNRKRALLVTERGTRFSSASVQQCFKYLYKDAGLENASSHSGRRTFITTLASKAVAPAVIQQLARHSSLQTTQLYISISEDKLAAAVELV